MRELSYKRHHSYEHFILGWMLAVVVATATSASAGTVTFYASAPSPAGANPIAGDISAGDHVTANELLDPSGINTFTALENLNVSNSAVAGVGSSNRAGLGQAPFRARAQPREPILVHRTERGHGIGDRVACRAVAPVGRKLHDLLGIDRPNRNGAGRHPGQLPDFDTAADPGFRRPALARWCTRIAGRGSPQALIRGANRSKQAASAAFFRSASV
jgi:hypothetical protein